MADERQHRNTSELLSMQLGQAGTDTITDTTATTPGGDSDEWCAIQALESTVVAAIAENDATLNRSVVTNTLAGISLKAGQVVFGTFTSITLTSGAVRCYREPIK